MGWPAGGAASEDGGRGRRGRYHRLRSFIFILLLAEISTADAAAESDGYGEFVWLLSDIGTVESREKGTRLDDAAYRTIPTP